MSELDQVPRTPRRIAQVLPACRMNFLALRVRGRIPGKPPCSTALIPQRHNHFRIWQRRPGDCADRGTAAFSERDSQYLRRVVRFRFTAGAFAFTVGLSYRYVPPILRTRGAAAAVRIDSINARSFKPFDVAWRLVNSTRITPKSRWADIYKTRTSGRSSRSRSTSSCPLRMSGFAESDRRETSVMTKSIG